VTGDQATARRGPLRALVPMLAVVALLHLVGFGLVRALADAPGGPALLGLALTAYTFGVRHAFDADHIAAIDNTTRTLTGSGTRPDSVGFWFSLGHSSVVFALVALVAGGVRAVGGPLLDDGSWLRLAGGTVGTTASGVFLCLIGLANLLALRDAVRARRAASRGVVPDADAGRPRGPLAAVLLPALRRVGRPRHMFGVGVLFGLGFDTASEVALLALAAGAGTSALPWFGVLALPLVFAAGMSLFDTLDGLMMCSAYRWALGQAGRRLTYNLVVTAVSVAVALGVGVIELAGVAGVAGVARFDVGWIGFALVGGFGVGWLWIVARGRRAAASLESA
jgi:nickel/cobalt transporter (NiCoT) family protein